MYRKGSIESEKNTIKKMIDIYCKDEHGSKLDLCPNCQGLLDYALKRLDTCKFRDAKPTCEKCTVHCYKPEMRDMVKIVMRFSGPRMIYKHPVDAIRHIIKNR